MRIWRKKSLRKRGRREDRPKPDRTEGWKMKLYIIRHGETVWNTEGRLQGHVDKELNENGIRLARLTAEKIRDIPFDLVISSPLKRALQTARIVTEGREIPILTDERIEEISFGEWEGLSCSKDHYELPNEFRMFFADPYNYQPPKGGESIAQLMERTRQFYEELCDNADYADKNILIAAHGCSSRALLNQVSLDASGFWRGKVPPNCSISVIEVCNHKGTILDIDRIYYDSGEIVDTYATE